MVESPAVLDRSLLYERVREKLRERCLAETGATLPPLRQLSSELNVNHFTISRALRDLQREGLVKILPRRGIFIQQQPQRPRYKNVELITFHAGLKTISSCLLQGVEEIAGNGMVHHTMLGHPPLPAPRVLLRELKERGIEGVLFNGVSYFKYPHSLAEANLIHEIAEQLPIVIVGGAHQIIAADCIYGDTRPAMKQYLETCKRKGFKRYAYLGANSRRPANSERFECFKNFILAHRLEWNESWVVYGTDKPHREVACRMLEQSVRPEVIVAYNASSAYAAIIEVQRCGLQPGRDVHILAFANWMSDVVALQQDATVVLLDELEVGRRAYQLLQEKTTNSKSEHEPHIERIPARFMNNLLEQ